MAGPCGESMRTAQPAQPPTAQAMYSSRHTWQGRDYARANAAVAASMGVGPQA